MSVVVPVRVPKELAQKINELTSRGLYSNRSDLIRESLRRFLVSERAFTQKTSVGNVVALLASSIIAWNEKTVTDVILFGSTARGEATFESDVDLLVLTEDPESWKIRQRLYSLVYPIIPTFGVDVSLIVINKKNFIHMAKNQDPFATSTINEGKQLQGDFLSEYGKSTHGKSP
jgi:Arc/MetJ-type ribon-helix-helix transcriptional regulator